MSLPKVLIIKYEFIFSFVFLSNSDTSHSQMTCIVIIVVKTEPDQNIRPAGFTYLVLRFFGGGYTTLTQ